MRLLAHQMLARLLCILSRHCLNQNTCACEGAFSVVWAAYDSILMSGAFPSARWISIAIASPGYTAITVRDAHLGQLDVSAVLLLAILQRVHIVTLKEGPVTQAAWIRPAEQCPQLLVRILQHQNIACL